MSPQLMAPIVTPNQDESDSLHREKTIASIRVVRGNAFFHAALLKEPPRPFTAASVVLHLSCLLGFLCSTMNGFDGSLLNGLFSNPAFKAYFGGSNDGLWAGIVSSIYQIGGVAALPFVGPATDTWGRRFGMFAGALLVVVGTIIQGTTIYTASVGQFMAGRFFVGFGVSIVNSAGPIYVVEVCHPAYRGIVTALYNTFWFTGSILSSGAVRGALGLEGEQSWLVPLWLQLLFSGILVLSVFLLPESPRWLYANDRVDQAKDMITKYHADGDSDSIWVGMQLHEYSNFLEMDGADKRWWDYSALFNTRAARYRMLCNLLVSVFGQWAGNAVLSYFLSAVLDTAGVTSPTAQLNINVGLACTQFAFAIAGAFLVDAVGRRPLLIGTNVACAAVWTGMVAATSQFAADPGNVAAAKATQALVYTFGIVFSLGFTPLQQLYPVEVLSFEMRAKGMAASQLATNLASLLNQFAWPVALQAIGWRTYVIFMVWCLVQAGVIYLVIPETKRRTLEELDLIFSARSPKRASLEKKSLALDSARNVMKVENA